jgi:uracil-DNA glycosylase
MSFKRKNPPVTSSSDPKKPKKNADLTSFFGPPKVTAAGGGKPVSLTNGAAAAVPEPPPAKFDKDKWVAGLSDEQRKLLKLEIDTLDPSWLAVLKDEVLTPGFLELKRFLQKEIDSKQKIYPPLEDVYSWYVLRCARYGHGRGHEQPHPEIPKC